MNISIDRVRRLVPGDPPEIGEYVVLGRLGTGSMGVVFLARSPQGKPVAVKLVHRGLAADPEFRARFRSEVARAREVSPFCTAQVLGADADHDPPYLIVEYIDGPNLGETVELYGPLAPANAVAVAVGVASALTAIHGAGVIHRDLKPRHVLLASGSTRVIDFGLARAFEATGGYPGIDILVGTTAFRAPEQLEADPARLTPAADIFAWGAVVLYAATGREPSDEVSVRLTAAPDLTGLTEPLRELVRRALDRNPEDRPSARGILDALLTPDPPVAGTGSAPSAAGPASTSPADQGWAEFVATGRTPTVAPSGPPGRHGIWSGRLAAAVGKPATMFARLSARPGAASRPSGTPDAASGPASGGTTSGRAASGGTTPGRAASGGTTPGRTASGGTTPGRAVFGRTTPGRTASGGTTPGRAVFGRTTPGRAASGRPPFGARASGSGAGPADPAGPLGMPHPSARHARSAAAIRSPVLAAVLVFVAAVLVVGGIAVFRNWRPGNPGAAPVLTDATSTPVPSEPGVPVPPTSATASAPAAPAPAPRRPSASATASRVAATKPTSAGSRPAPPAARVQAIRSDLNGKCLDAVGAVPQMAPCAAGKTWQFVSDGTVRRGDQCLTVQNAATTDGTAVGLTPCAPEAAGQRWQFSGNRDLVNPNADKCLDVVEGNAADGARVQIWTCLGVTNQKWTLA